MHSGVRRVDRVLGVPGDQYVAVRVLAPGPRPHDPPVALCCVPGGGATMAYFDLTVEGHPVYSFAEYAAARGLIVIIVDTLGTGASSRPADPWLPAEVFARANTDAFDQVAGRLREGTFSADLPAYPGLVTIGLGHSMGAMLTLVAQAARPRHVALAVLGFTTAGLPEVLTPEERLLSGTPRRFPDELAELARKRFGGRGAAEHRAPFPFSLPDTPPAVARAYAATGTALLPVPALLSLIPGNAADAAAAVDVPVFAAAGDHEPWGRPDALAAQFPATRDLTAYVLEGAAHNHNIAGTRLLLWRRLCGWAGRIAGSNRQGDET